MDQKVINYDILNSEDNLLKYFSAIYLNSDIMYCTLQTKLIDKIYFKDVEKILHFDKKTEIIKLTDLKYNSEDNYISLELNDINENGVPIFKMNSDVVELSAIRLFWTTKILIPYYEFKFKRMSKKNAK